MDREAAPGALVLSSALIQTHCSSKAMELTVQPAKPFRNYKRKMMDLLKTREINGLALAMHQTSIGTRNLDLEMLTT